MGGEVHLSRNAPAYDGTLMQQDPLILRPSEGVLVRLETTTALTAGAWTFAFKAVLAEFSYP